MVAQLMFVLFTNGSDDETLLPQHRLRKTNKIEVKRFRANAAQQPNMESLMLKTGLANLPKF
jgi:hypothetical protein